MPCSDQPPTHLLGRSSTYRCLVRRKRMEGIADLLFSLVLRSKNLTSMWCHFHTLLIHNQLAKCLRSNFLTSKSHCTLLWSIGTWNPHQISRYCFLLVDWKLWWIIHISLPNQRQALPLPHERYRSICWDYQNYLHFLDS